MLSVIDLAGPLKPLKKDLMTKSEDAAAATRGRRLRKLQKGKKGGREKKQNKKGRGSMMQSWPRRKRTNC